RGRRWLNLWSRPSRPARHWIDAETDRIAGPRTRSFRSEFFPAPAQQVERPGGFAWLNRRRWLIDYGIVRFARDVRESQGGEQNEDFAVVQGRIGFEPRLGATGVCRPRASR